MSTVVYQNLASSCFESPLTETTTTLKLKVAPPPPPVALDLFKKQGIDCDHSKNLEFGRGPGFLQTVPKESGDYTESNYTDPWAKKSSFSSLSAISLELCTESLGSETGSDIITDGGAAIFSSPPSPPLISPSKYSTFHSERAEIDNNNCKQKLNPPKYPDHKEASNHRETRNFPPPLTTMSGASSLQVRRHKEGGSLIIEAVEAPFRNSYLQTERSDGRLRLSLLTVEATTSAAAVEEDVDDEWEGETAAEEEEETEEAISEVELELGIELEKRQWLSRCKGGRHGNKGLCNNWKPALWVTIS